MSNFETTLPTSMANQIGRTSSLLDALDAVSKWQPFALLLLTFLSSLLLGSVFGALVASIANTSGTLAGITGFIGFVITISVAVVGFNATGMWLSDDVWGRQQRSIKDSLLGSFFTCHRLIAVLAIEFLLFLIFIVALTLVLFICKIPGIGPFLYAFAMPLGVISSGVVLFALLYVAIPLAAPAIWNGTPTLRTVVMLQLVARNRLFKAVVMMLLLGILTLMVVGFVTAVLVFGSMVVVSLSAAVLDISSLGLNSIMSIFTHSGFGMSGYSYAIGFGISFLLMVASIPGVLIALKGASIIYRDVSEGLNFEEEERSLNEHMTNVKARAEAARQNALAPRVQQGAPIAERAAVAAPVPALACPACNAVVTSEDVFCGECGHKLK